MKRPPPAIRRRIIEVQGAARSTRIDPRADPLATTKISRAELDAVLNRTTSGTRPVVRYDDPQLRAPEPPDDEWPGPRDDAPEITIRKIESVELDLQGNPVLETQPQAQPQSQSQPPSGRSSAPPSPLVPALAHAPAPDARTDARAQTSPVREFRPEAPPAIELSREVLPPAPWRRNVVLTILVVLAALAALTATFLAGRLSVH